MKVPMCRKMGLSIVLSDSEENRIVEWFQLTQEQDFEYVQKLLKIQLKKSIKS